jgi:hypothetical protein
MFALIVRFQELAIQNFTPSLQPVAGYFGQIVGGSKWGFFLQCHRICIICTVTVVFRLGDLSFCISHLLISGDHDGQGSGHDFLGTV